MPHDLKFKSFEIKSHKAEADGSLIIEGYGAIFGNVDSVNDVINPGAFTKTLQERADRIAFCLQHDIYNPIGKILDIKEDSIGLWLQVKLSAAEQDTQTKIREGILTEMSIGYRVINCLDGTVDGKSITYLNEVMLYEVSLVTIAANELAIITGMKSDEKKDFIKSEFERLIVIERNPQKKFELMKLKAEIETLIKEEPKQITPPKIEPLTTAQILEYFL